MTTFDGHTYPGLKYFPPIVLDVGTKVDSNENRFSSRQARNGPYVVLHSTNVSTQQETSTFHIGRSTYNNFSKVSVPLQ